MMTTSAPSKNLKGKKKKKKGKKRVLLIAGSLPAPEIIGTGDSLNPMVRRNPEATGALTPRNPHG